MKKVIACIACVLLPVCYAMAQTAKPSSLKEQAARLKTFFDQHEIEKAYLHFDKPYYAAGDTIYFKAYVVAGEKNVLSPLSGVLYADLITPQNKIINAIKLQVIGGLAWGDFALPDSLVAGNYRVRAYTKLMQNYGGELFFDRTIPIAAIIEKPVKKAPATMQAIAPEIQFFPEGGELVPGIPAKIAFKALRGDGTGIAASGVILDGAGKAVSNLSTSHLGMGSISYTPHTGKSYHAEITFADGSKSSIQLPVADSTAVAMAVNNLPGKLAIAINAGGGFFHANKNKPLNLLFYSGGKLTTFTDKLTNREMKFDLESNRLQTGITQITLLAADGTPLCERLVFIDNNDKLDLGIATDKKEYQQREKIKVSLHINTADLETSPAHFSVAVIDRSKVDIIENKEENILTYLLLTSNLKGYIEEPGYYFININNKKREDLDLAMLTHGYRRFTWKNIVNNDLPPTAIRPEKALSINGRAKSISGKPLNKGLVTLIPSKGGSLLSENTNEDGAFSFQNLAFYDTTRFVLNAVNDKGKNNTTLTYKPEPLVPISPVLYASTDTSNVGNIHAYLANSQKQHSEYLKYYGKGIQLKEVKIQAVKKFNYYTQSLAGAGNADVLIKGIDLPRSGMLATLLAGRIGGVYFASIDNPDGGVPKMQIGNGSAMLVVVDGVQRTSEPGRPVGINDIWPGDIETIEVLKYGSATVYGMGGGNGVMVITTKQGAGTTAKDIISSGVLPLTVTGFYKAREFYAPRYDYIDNRTRPDLRSTIFWLPEITTDKNGNASFDFYNADGTGQYQIIIEGINNNGTAGAAKFSYKVTE
ncbi:TonB-dependent receptor plug domain-containing protein [Mucilaginibacter sp.]|uniref:TonB-dependent receptor plug domain-containing protein n=1 Tax=Mucilaginibacter sp. TaxID=1882438 RepID=UPI003262E8F1